MANNVKIEALATALHAARGLLVQDRSDWRKPHILWLPEALFRPFSTMKGKGRPKA